MVFSKITNFLNNIIETSDSGKIIVFLVLGNDAVVYA